ncbi:MAG: hypothetical protein AABZ62_03990 [Planctomycetota bacterium]
MHAHGHTHNDDDSHKGHSASSSHGESCPAGVLGSAKFIMILLTVLSLAFGYTMMQRYRALEAKLSTMGIAISEGSNVQAAQHNDPKAEEQAKAISELGHKLGALKLTMNEIDSLLKELGVKVEAQKAAGPHGGH